MNAFLEEIGGHVVVQKLFQRHPEKTSTNGQTEKSWKGVDRNTVPLYHKTRHLFRKKYAKKKKKAKTRKFIYTNYAPCKCVPLAWWLIHGALKMAMRVRSLRRASRLSPGLPVTGPCVSVCVRSKNFLRVFVYFFLFVNITFGIC